VAAVVDVVELPEGDVVVVVDFPGGLAGAAVAGLIPIETRTDSDETIVHKMRVGQAVQALFLFPMCCPLCVLRLQVGGVQWGLSSHGLAPGFHRLARAPARAPDEAVQALTYGLPLPDGVDGEQLCRRRALSLALARP
jgi:hypothetical protein